MIDKLRCPREGLREEVDGILFTFAYACAALNREDINFDEMKAYRFDAINSIPALLPDEQEIRKEEREKEQKRISDYLFEKYANTSKEASRTVAYKIAKEICLDIVLIGWNEYVQSLSQEGE